MKSPIPLLLSLSLALLPLPGARAQSADDFFHGGALQYLSNNIPGALTTVTNGLVRYPNDDKLKKLHELLNQQQQDQQQQDQEKKNEEKKEDQQQDKNDQQQDQQAPDEQKKAGGDKPQEQPDQQKPAGDPKQVEAHAMTPQEAKQLLDAQKDDEQVLIFQPQGEPKNQTKRLKDW